MKCVYVYNFLLYYENVVKSPQHSTKCWIIGQKMLVKVAEVKYFKNEVFLQLG